jgi:hypothetical protein
MFARFKLEHKLRYERIDYRQSTIVIYKAAILSLLQILFECTDSRCNIISNLTMRTGLDFKYSQFVRHKYFPRSFSMQNDTIRDCH